ncbi:hypothetical protein CAEBREN_06084 [Caenorhabditis brenneri]|uniref:Uncharacterized protein n=1 Tax=Caenorhabditis brenneri TaxID=135651 RepID=G0PH94_CAEBE|nr:hypothetical protein CAEBREN_06084 [Caenorhabditis brenneri]
MAELAVLVAKTKMAIDAVKKIQEVIKLVSAASKIQELMTHRTLGDIAVLQTMIQRVAESSNKKLHEDFAKHKIVERLNHVARELSDDHSHGFGNTNSGDESFTIFECVRNKGMWKQKTRALYVTAGVMSAPLLFLPAIYMGYCAVDMERHINETERELKFCVEEIESIFDQTNSLMLANIV